MIETLPEITAAAGYVLGQGSEQIALAYQAATQKRAIDAYGGTERVHVRQGVVRRALSVLALTGAMTGFAAGEMAQTHHVSIMERPSLTEAVDLTYGTGHGLGGDGTDTLIGAISADVAHSRSMHVQIEAAHDSRTETLSAAQVGGESGWGSPNLAQTVQDSIQTAYATAGPNLSNAFGSEQGRAAGVLVVTDGDAIGKRQEITAEAAAHGEPIFVANLGAKNDSIAQDLRAVTRATHGQYWQIQKQSKPQAIASAIESKIEPRAIAHKSFNLWPYMLPLLVGSVLAHGVHFVNRMRRTRGE